jgi:kynureninase
VLKWLCGGPGGAFLYASPEGTRGLSPSFTGWQAHEHPFAFEREMAYADNAWKWLNGTPSIPSLFAAIDGPRLVRQAGIENIRAKSMRQTTRLIELADARGYTVTAPRNAEQRGGTVALDVPHAYGVSQALLANDIIVDYRPNAGIRIGPHFYTSDDELERAIDMVDAILRDGSWTRFEEMRGVVT